MEVPEYLKPKEDKELPINHTQVTYQIITMMISLLGSIMCFILFVLLR